MPTSRPSSRRTSQAAVTKYTPSRWWALARHVGSPPAALRTPATSVGAHDRFSVKEVDVNTVEVEDLQHKYGSARSGVAPAVDNVSFEVAEGEFFAMLGPSGCGKTTTLRCIAGLERPTSGVIRLNGEMVVSGGRFLPTHR